VVTTGAISRAKLQPNHHHQQPNIQFFLQAGCPSCRPTNSVKALKENITFHGLAYPELTWGLPTLCLWRYKFTPTLKAKLLWMTSHYRPGMDKGCSSWVRRQSKNMQASGPCRPNLDRFNPNSTGFDTRSRTTTVPSFESFRSGVFVLSCYDTHPQTYIHAHIVTK